jgi:hypothetical protein
MEQLMEVGNIPCTKRGEEGVHSLAEGVVGGLVDK